MGIFSVTRNSLQSSFAIHVIALIERVFYNDRMLKAIFRVVLTALALMAIAYIVPGIAITSFTVALIVAVLWGLITLLVRPILLLLTLPITLLTLGLSTFILNAILFWLLSILVTGFTISGFLPALEGSLLLTVVGWALHALV